MLSLVRFIRLIRRLQFTTLRPFTTRRRLSINRRRFGFRTVTNSGGKLTARLCTKFLVAIRYRLRYLSPAIGNIDKKEISKFLERVSAPYLLLNSEINNDRWNIAKCKFIYYMTRNLCYPNDRFYSITFYFFIYLIRFGHIIRFNYDRNNYKIGGRNQKSRH